jgi:hypothetical protein
MLKFILVVTGKCITPAKDILNLFFEKFKKLLSIEEKKGKLCLVVPDLTAISLSGSDSADTLLARIKGKPAITNSSEL